MFYSCNEKGDLIELRYINSFPKRTKNLTFKLGKEFSIKHNNDTLNFSVLFQKENRFNYIINVKTKDTIFSGTVNKYKGLYFFNEQLNDSTYWIYAVKIKNGSIKGLGTGWYQMIYLEGEITKALNKENGYNGELESLIEKVNKDTTLIYLIPKKKILRAYYATIIDSFPSDTIISGFNIEYRNELLKTTHYVIDTTLKEGPKSKIIKNLYPNPADEYIILEVDKPNEDIFTIVDINGKIFLTGKIFKRKMKIDVSAFPSGTYFIRLDKENGKNETRKFIIE